MSSRERASGGSRQERGPHEEAPYDPAPKIFVGGIPFSLSFEEIKELFATYGTITEITVPRCLHDPRKHKGFGFITYDSFRSMDDVIAKMDGREVRGQVLSVQRATLNRPKHDGPDRGGHGPDRGQRYSGPGHYTSSGGRDYRDAGGSSGGGYGRDSYRGGSGYKYEHQNGSGSSRYDSGRSSYSMSADDVRPAGSVKPNIGYRCRVTGLAADVDWRLLKDFLRQIGNVTYTQVDAAGGRGIGEYMTLSEVRDAVDKLTGAAINGSIVKLTPLNFDIQTGEKFEPPTGVFDNCRDSRHDDRSSRGHHQQQQYDDRGPARDSRHYDSGTSRGGGGYTDRYSSRTNKDSSYSGRYNSHYDDGGAGYNNSKYDEPHTSSRARGDYDYDSRGASGGGYGGYDDGRGGCGGIGEGRYQPHRRDRERSLDRSYQRPQQPTDAEAPLARGAARSSGGGGGGGGGGYRDAPGSGYGSAYAGGYGVSSERDVLQASRAAGAAGAGGEFGRGVSEAGHGGEDYGDGAGGYEGGDDGLTGVGGNGHYGGSSGVHTGGGEDTGPAAATAGGYGGAAAAPPSASHGGSSRYGGAGAAIGGSSRYGSGGGGTASGLSGGLGSPGFACGGSAGFQEGGAGQQPAAAAAGGAAANHPGPYCKPWRA